MRGEGAANPLSADCQGKPGIKTRLRKALAHKLAVESSALRAEMAGGGDSQYKIFWLDCQFTSFSANLASGEIVCWLLAGFSEFLMKMATMANAAMIIATFAPISIFFARGLLVCQSPHAFKQAVNAFWQAVTQGFA